MKNFNRFTHDPHFNGGEVILNDAFGEIFVAIECDDEPEEQARKNQLVLNQLNDFLKP